MAVELNVKWLFRRGSQIANWRAGPDVSDLRRTARRLMENGLVLGLIAEARIVGSERGWLRSRGGLPPVACRQKTVGWVMGQ